jgi:hypothetical protein
MHVCICAVQRSRAGPSLAHRSLREYAHSFPVLISFLEIYILLIYARIYAAQRSRAGPSLAPGSLPGYAHSFPIHNFPKIYSTFSHLHLCRAEVACWSLAGTRQSARIRSKYLKAILRQDIGFFDTETSTGEVVGRMSGDTLQIQEAIGEKVSGLNERVK